MFFFKKKIALPMAEHRAACSLGVAAVLVTIAAVTVYRQQQSAG